MKRLVATLAVAGLGMLLAAGPSSAQILFTYSVDVNATPTYANFFPVPTVFPASVGTATYTITPANTSGLGIFGENDASGTGADIVLASNQLSSSSTSPSTFNFLYTLNLRVYRDDDPLDFADFAINGRITGSNVKNGSATTSNTYLPGVPPVVTAFSAVTNTRFDLTRLDFTFPQAPPITGGPGLPGAFSAHIESVVPEPGPIGLMSGLLVAGSAFTLRRRRAS
jgi:hypothetical protein